MLKIYNDYDDVNNSKEDELNGVNILQLRTYDTI